MLNKLRAQHDTLQKELPPSLVAVSGSVETARRLQQDWNALADHEAAEKRESAQEANLDRIKGFLDTVASAFAAAESAMANARLLNVEPVCRALFKSVMGQSAVPALIKKSNTEELHISLAECWSLKDFSGQALLSESYRNAFAVSVYLAAASLYGGAPRFMVLDDVTSSFDAGHQLQLMSVLRTQFARPGNPNGPQVIVLSHDTMLEKLFNKNSGSSDWPHQRLEGTARTAVLLQSGAETKTLNDKAGILVLDANQKAGLALHETTIAGNYLSHWETGLTSGFSAPALQMVMLAIDAFVECFQWMPTSGDKRFYKSPSKK